MEKLKSFLVWARITDAHDGMLSTTTMLMLNALSLVWFAFGLLAYEVICKGATVGVAALALVMSTFGGALVALMQKKSRGLKHAELAEKDALKEVKAQIDAVAAKPLDELRQEAKEFLSQEIGKMKSAINLAKMGQGR